MVLGGENSSHREPFESFVKEYLSTGMNISALFGSQFHLTSSLIQDFIHRRTVSKEVTKSSLFAWNRSKVSQTQQSPKIILGSTPQVSMYDRPLLASTYPKFY